MPLFPSWILRQKHGLTRFKRFVFINHALFLLWQSQVLLSIHLFSFSFKWPNLFFQLFWKLPRLRRIFWKTPRFHLFIFLGHLKDLVFLKIVTLYNHPFLKMLFLHWWNQNRLKLFSHRLSINMSNCFC